MEVFIIGGICLVIIGIVYFIGIKRSVKTKMVLPGVLRHGKSRIDLAIDPAFSSPKIVESITTGKYEWAEAEAAKKLLMPSDRVLELGAGLGFMSSFIMKTVPVAAYVAVEADQRLIPFIRESHRLNGVSGVCLKNCAVVSSPVDLARGHVEFQQAAAFWGSRVSTKKERQTVRVPAAGLDAVIMEHDISVLLIDIEGGEVELLAHADLSRIRAVCLEIHPKVIGREGVANVFDALHRQGLVYDAGVSRGKIVAFSR